MLFPFDKRAISVESLPRDYMATVLADMRRFRFTGYGLFMAEPQTLTIAFRDGLEIGAASWWPRLGLQRLTDACVHVLDHAPETVSVHLLSAPADAVAMLRLYLRGKEVLRLPSETSGARLLSLCPPTGDFVLARRLDAHCELAAISNGRVEAGYRFDEPTRVFVRVGGAEFFEDAAPGGFYEVIEPSLIHPKPALDSALEPLDILMEKYIAALNLCEQVLREAIDVRATGLVDQLLEHLKGKYPPLYRGVYRNPETGFINWEQIRFNREKVNVQYRYDRFVLYLDEIVMKYLQLIQKEGGAALVERLGSAIVRLRDASPDLDFEPVQLLFARLAKLIAAALAQKT